MCELLCRRGVFAMNASMPKDWNAAYEDDDTPWDKGIAAPPLRAFLAKHPIRGRVLVPGCGLGHDVRLLAEQGASVVGLDIVPKAVRQAGLGSNPVVPRDRSSQTPLRTTFRFLRL